MLYQVSRARIRDDGSIQCRKLRELFQHPKKLEIGCLYLINKNIYMVIEQIL